MNPKCGVKAGGSACGAREWRMVGIIRQGRLDKILYQCSNGHVHLLPDEIRQTQNPLETIV